MIHVPRVSAEAVRHKLRGKGTVLVCAHEEEAKFEAVRVEGAISLFEFERRLPMLPRDFEIVFYCD